MIPAPYAATVRIFGVPFVDCTYEQVRDWTHDALQSGAPHHIVIANAYTLNLAYGDPSYRRILESAALVLRDGVGVELAAAILGRRLRQNFVGTDFVPRLVADVGGDVFLYGSAPGVAAAAGRALAARGSHIRIVGVADGYGDPDRVLGRVRAASPDVLLVALGNPLQERWIATHLRRSRTRVAIGVGALLDNLAGRVVRAPAWVRRARCEWLYRLYREPRRMWRRYLLGNPVFLWRSLLAARREAW